MLQLCWRSGTPCNKRASVDYSTPADRRRRSTSGAGAHGQAVRVLPADAGALGATRHLPAEPYEALSTLLARDCNKPQQTSMLQD